MKKLSLMLQALIVLGMSVSFLESFTCADVPSATTNNNGDGSPDTDSSSNSPKKTWKEKAKSDVGTVVRFGKNFASNLSAMGAEGVEPDYDAMKEGGRVVKEGVTNVFKRPNPPPSPEAQEKKNVPPTKKTSPSTTQKKQSSEIAREKSHIEQELAQNTRDINLAQKKGDEKRVQELEKTRRTLQEEIKK